MSGLLKSCLCTQAGLESPALRQWIEPLRETFHVHRKLWEYCYIVQALAERGLLAPGRRGLGFAVGQEPLAALFASLGCEIVATDLAEERAREQGWVASNQHASNLAVLNQRGICDPAVFAERVTFRYVDMNDIPPDLDGFDFLWSSCAFEHLGTIEHGKRFVERAMDCLVPGGVAVHTTEYNVSSNTATVDHGGYVLFRRRDIEDLAERLRRRGHEIVLDFDPGRGEYDRQFDAPPYQETVHLKLQVSGFIATSIGLIIRKAP
ncbi:MAG: class I SAM-dependent methyltransferase [Chloroflexi bacterium]|nr:class I SAM-dependent methyltransferase [Chloroflexota bacterium]